MRVLLALFLYTYIWEFSWHCCGRYPSVETRRLWTDKVFHRVGSLEHWPLSKTEQNRAGQQLIAINSTHFILLSIFQIRVLVLTYLFYIVWYYCLVSLILCTNTVLNWKKNISVNIYTWAAFTNNYMYSKFTSLKIKKAVNI